MAGTSGGCIAGFGARSAAVSSRLCVGRWSFAPERCRGLHLPYRSRRRPTGPLIRIAHARVAWLPSCICSAGRPAHRRAESGFTRLAPQSGTNSRREKWPGSVVMMGQARVLKVAQRCRHLQAAQVLDPGHRKSVIAVAADLQTESPDFSAALLSLLKPSD